MYDDAFRVLLVDLTHPQSQLVSDSFNSIELAVNIVVYVWNCDSTMEWLIDKKHKSNLVIFNADSLNAELVGYLAAQHNSHYMGTLRSIGITNTRAMKDQSQCSEIFTHYIVNYDQR